MCVRIRSVTVGSFLTIKRILWSKLKLKYLQQHYPALKCVIFIPLGKGDSTSRQLDKAVKQATRSFRPPPLSVRAMWPLAAMVDLHETAASHCSRLGLVRFRNRTEQKSVENRNSRMPDFRIAFDLSCI